MQWRHVQDAWLNSPWRAEPLYELAKWHDQQLRNCTAGDVHCEQKHHMGAFLNAKMVRDSWASIAVAHAPWHTSWLRRSIQDWPPAAAHGIQEQ